MKIYSEKTGEQYKTVKECLAAEKDYEEKLAKEKEEKTRLAEERKNRAKEVENAFSKAQEAQKDYIELRNKFVQDYGAFHMTFSDRSIPMENFFEDFFRFF